MRTLLRRCTPAGLAAGAILAAYLMTPQTGARAAEVPNSAKDVYHAGTAEAPVSTPDSEYTGELLSL